jgi:mRNA-degrading endonuclease RelE of RelBE toxin-antitoxin system
MNYRLLVDLEAITLLDSMPKRDRKQVLDHFVRLRSTPDMISDEHEQDRLGRRVEISIVAGYAIHYWIDFADRHVKVLAIRPAARRK